MTVLGRRPEQFRRGVTRIAALRGGGFWRETAINLARLLLLVGALASLIAVRLDIPFYVYPIATGVLLAALYATVRGGSDFRVWAMYILAFVLFAHLRTLADETGNPTQFGYPIDLEKALFMGTVPTVWLQDHLYSFGKTRALELFSAFIYLTYFFAPHLAALAVWRLDRGRFRLYVVAVLITFYLGLAVSYVVPTAPPWLAGQSGDLPHVFRILQDIAGRVSPGAYQQAYEVAGPNDVAAMPSLHIAVTFIIAFMAWRFHPAAGGAALLYAVFMGFVLVYLGEHYVVDLLAGLGLAFVSWKLADRWWRRRELGQREALTGGPAEGRAGLG